MMTREEVAEIVTYCREHKMTYKDRLEELNLSRWRFYRSKSRYAAEQQSGSTPAGEFIELPQSGTFVPMPSFAATSGRKGKNGIPGPDAGLKSVEIRTNAGAAIRIQGELTEREMCSIIKACSNVQP